MAISVEQFIARLSESGLMPAAEVSTFQESLPPAERPRDVQALAASLVKAGKLTKYQAQAVYQGKTKGLVFDEYVVLDKLGEGGMGVVLKARHRRMDRLVAIKVLSAGGMKAPEAVERFHREVKAAAKLSHPNIVTAFDAGEHQDMHYLVTEYVEGKDLAAIIHEKGPLPVAEAVECIVQAARGLEYAHEEGVVHRDIKPSNLLVDKKGTVKILDMGLARIAGAEAAPGGADRLTTSGQVMGTCDYMSPEQALDTYAADHRTDIYALGCTLYRLLTGNPPYQRETLMQILLAHRESPIPSLCAARAEVPAELDACFQRMVAKEPGDRQQSMGQVVAELEAVLGIASGRSARALAARTEPSSGALAMSLAFLQEDAPPGTPAKQRQPTAAERTQPRIGREHDTGSDILGKARGAVARLRQRPRVMLGLAGGLVLLLGIVLTLTLRRGTLLVEIDEQLGKDVRVAVSQGGELVEVVDAKSGWAINLRSGRYEVAVRGGDDQLQLDSDSITVKRREQVKLKVTLKPKSPPLPPGEGPRAVPGVRTAGPAPPPAVAPFDEKKAKEHQAAWAKHLGVPVEMTNSIGMKLVLMPPGEFQMGSPKELIEEELKAHADDQWYKDHLPGEGPQHRVRITKPFCLGVTEVTQEEYQQVMGKNPSGFSATGKQKDKVGGQDTKRFPVENVSWDEAVEFCRKLSDRPEEKVAGRWYRLPSEAQWEHACRAGSMGRFSFSSGRSGIPKESEEHELSDHGWFAGNCGAMTHAVGGKRASAWGLYDMHGNVWEWCQDWYDKDYYEKSVTDNPAGPPGGSFRVFRGGCWFGPAGSCRSAIRGYDGPGFSFFVVGLRVSLVLADKPAGPTSQPQPLRPPPESVVQARPKPKLEPKPKAEAKPGPKAGPETAEKPAEKPVGKPDAVGPQNSETAARGKQPVPDEASLEKAATLARDSFKDDYAKAKTAAQKLAIAANLRKTARQGTADPAERFVLLRLARDIAVQAGDVTAAFAAIDEMAQTFAVDSLAMKSEMLAAMAEKAKPDSRGQLTDAAVELIPQAMGAENFDVAKELAGVAGSLAGKVRDRELAQRVRAAQKELADNVKAAEAVEAARETLKGRPADPDANLVFGRYQCFVRSQWNEGLKRLAGGADEELKALAQEDMGSRQANRDESVKLADAWWNLSRKAGGKHREGMALRAGAWYRQALEEGLPAGILRTRVEKRLAEIEKLGREICELPDGPPRAKAPLDAKTARSLQARWARHLKVPIVQTNSIGMKLVLIPPGEFTMASPKELIEEELRAHAADSWYTDRLPGEGPQHRVRITKPFYLGMYVVTQGEYQRVMGNNPSEFSATGKGKDKVSGQDTKRFPVEQVSWDEAVEFSRKLSELPAEKAAGWWYRLPSEAQWEYACRAGSTTRFCFGDDERLLAEYGWCGADAGGMTHAVGGKRPSAWGLYDMHGNVWEWCQDWYDKDYYARSATDDPSGPPGGSDRVFRGGGWNDPARRCRSAYRAINAPGARYINLGLRVSRVLADK
jgi:formylglycine-generating enzyme required for sulfatase activity/serine/threonine protein kinase